MINIYDAVNIQGHNKINGNLGEKKIIFYILYTPTPHEK